MQNHTPRLLTALAAVTIVSTPAAAAILAGPIVNPANGHEYYLLTQNTWANSEAEAITLGGHLVTISDADENQWVYDTFSTYDGVDRGLWIGLTDDVAYGTEEGTFVWTSGEPVTYTNWATLEPSSFTGEHYAHFIQPSAIPNVPPQLNIQAGQWNDRPDADFVEFYHGQTAPAFGVVEVIPVSPVIGDTDGDGDVDDFDLINAIVAYTGSLDAGVGGKTVADGDTDNDGDVDDFDLINMIVGYTGSLSAPTTVVPEPASVALLGLGGLLLGCRRR